MQRYEHGGDIYGEQKIRLDFSVNTNPLGLPQSAFEAIIATPQDLERYPDPQCRQLKAKLAYQYNISPDNLLFGNGASDLIFRICTARRPNLALTLAPSFSEYERAVIVLGGKMRSHLLSANYDFVLGADVLEAITPEIDIFFLCNPNNPTGLLVDPDLLRKIATKCEATGTWLVLDECFIDFTEAPSWRKSCLEYNNVIVLNAFTKTYAMAGLRLGYLIANAQLYHQISPCGPEWNVSVAAQNAGLAVLDDPTWLTKTRKLVSTERTYLTNALRSLGLAVLPSDANFILIRSECDLFTPLSKQGILIRRCENFDGLDRHYYRIAITTHEKMAELVNTLSVILHG